MRNEKNESRTNTNGAQPGVNPTLCLWVFVPFRKIQREFQKPCRGIVRLVLTIAVRRFCVIMNNYSHEYVHRLSESPAKRQRMSDNTAIFQIQILLFLCYLFLRHKHVWINMLHVTRSVIRAPQKQQQVQLYKTIAHYYPNQIIIYTWHPASTKCIMQVSLVLQAQSMNGISFRLKRNLAMTKWWGNIWPRGLIILMVYNRCFFQVPIFSFTTQYKRDWWKVLAKRSGKSKLFDTFYILVTFQIFFVVVCFLSSRHYFSNFED